MTLRSCLRHLFLEFLHLYIPKDNEHKDDEEKEVEETDLNGTPGVTSL